MKNNILHILSKKKLQLVFLFYILLVLPLLCPVAQNISVLNSALIIAINIVLYFSIAFLSLFCTSVKEKILYTAILVFSIVPQAIYMGYLLFAHVLLEGNSVTSLFETNPEESKEFVANYLSPWVTIAMLVYATIPAIMIWSMKSVKPLRVKEHKVLFCSSILIIIAIFSLSRLSQSVYAFNFYKTYVSYQCRQNYEQKAVAERQIHKYDVQETGNIDSIPQTIVVVIGESETRTHMQIYGYRRNTTPLLSARKDNLFAYADVVSPQVHTIPVIRSILTFSDRDNPDFVTEKPSLFELFNRAGWNTYFITNQPFGGRIKSSYDVFLNLAQHKYNLSVKKQNDEVVLPTLKQILETDSDHDKLIVVHLIGNHMAYEYRYPKSFEKFDNKKDHLVADAPYRDNAAKIMIDRYDNSVLYNDFIVDSIINMLAVRKNEETSMIYFSDHGEELYDKRKFAGHVYEKISPYMCEVPFILWVSDTYKDMNPDIVYDIKRPFSTGNFIYSISDLGGLRYKDYDPKKSLFSVGFKPSERYVGDKTYEEVLKLR